MGDYAKERVADGLHDFCIVEKQVRDIRMCMKCCGGFKSAKAHLQVASVLMLKLFIHGHKKTWQQIMGPDNEDDPTWANLSDEMKKRLNERTQEVRQVMTEAVKTYSDEEIKKAETLLEQVADEDTIRTVVTWQLCSTLLDFGADSVEQLQKRGMLTDAEAHELMHELGHDIKHNNKELETHTMQAVGSGKVAPAHP